MHRDHRELANGPGEKRVSTFARVMSIGVLSIALGACGASGDAERGRELYFQCAACHALKVNLVGPKHCGLFGRRAGSLTDFVYSDAMKSIGVVWDAKTLDEFLASPLTYVDGTTMGSVGVPDERDRSDLIAYLRQASSDDECGS
jgi:cytochrome c